MSKARRRYVHAQREKDVDGVDNATIMSVAQWGQTRGFPFTYRWLQKSGAISRTAAGRMIGNAVPPLMMRSVARWIIDAGFEPGEWGD